MKRIVKYDETIKNYEKFFIEKFLKEQPLTLEIFNGNTVAVFNDTENKLKFCVSISGNVYTLSAYKPQTNFDYRQITFKLEKTEDEEFHKELIGSLLSFFRKSFYLYVDENCVKSIIVNYTKSEAILFFDIVGIKQPTKPEKYRCCYELKYTSSAS